MATTAFPSGLTRQLLESVGKFAASRLRRLGALEVAPDWQQRASVCERCALRVVSCGVSYCGKPYLQQLQRDPAVEGCGCSCRDKAKSPGEHCPIDIHYQAAFQSETTCSCKWCASAG
jgi:hypothetical protein